MKKTEHLLYERLSKLRLLAALIYDQCRAADMPDEEMCDAIKPLQHQRDELIKKAVQNDLGDVIIAIKNIEEDAASDTRKARRHTEKAQEAMDHAGRIREALKAHMLSKGQTEWIDGNYMATIVDSKLEVR